MSMPHGTGLGKLQYSAQGLLSALLTLVLIGAAHGNDLMVCTSNYLGFKMTDLIKIIFAAIGVAVTVYVTVTSSLQTHDFRINQLEKTIDRHMEQHNVEYKEIQSMLMDLKVNVVKNNK